MRQNEILGIEKLNGLFQKRLIDGKVVFIDTKKKNNVKTGINSEKKVKK